MGGSMNKKQRVPEKFLKTFMESLPASLIHNIDKLGFDLDEFIRTESEDYLNSEKSNNEIKRSNDVYHSKRRNQFYESAVSAFNGDSKHLKILGPFSNIFSEGLEYTDEKGIKLYREWIDEIEKWKSDYSSLASDFPLFDYLSKTQKNNAIRRDVQKLLIEYVNDKYSGLREFIYSKSTSAILDHNFFGHPRKLGGKSELVVRGGSSVSYEHVNLATEQDAKVFNACYHLGFNDIMTSNTIEVDISDVTQYVYSNRASKNKQNVMDSLNRLGSIGYKAELNNDEYRVQDEFYFFQRITLIEEKKTVRKKVIARITLNDQYRKHILKNLSISYNQSFKQIPLKVKYSFLINQYILKVRNEALTQETIIHTVSIENLKKHINFSENEDIFKVINVALDSLKKSETYLDDYAYENDSLILYIEGVDSSEGAHISMMREVVQAQLKLDNMDE